MWFKVLQVNIFIFYTCTSDNVTGKPLIQEESCRPCALSCVQYARRVHSSHLGAALFSQRSRWILLFSQRVSFLVARSFFQDAGEYSKNILFVCIQKDGLTFWENILIIFPTSRQIKKVDTTRMSDHKHDATTRRWLAQHCRADRNHQLVCCLYAQGFSLTLNIFDNIINGLKQQEQARY